MRLFGLGKPNVGKLKEAGDVQGLAAALKDSDSVVRAQSFDGLIDFTVDPRYRSLNTEALAVLQEQCADATRSRLKSLLSEINPYTISWRNAAVMEALILIGSVDAVEAYFDRHTKAETADGGFVAEVAGFLVRYAAARRDRRLLKKLLIAGPFGSPDGLRLGSSASDVPEAHFAASAAAIGGQQTMADVGKVFCDLSSEDDLLEVASTGGAGHALPVIFDALTAAGTPRSLPVLERIAQQTSTHARERATRAIMGILRRIPTQDLMDLAQGQASDALRIPGLRTLCERADPRGSDLILKAVNHPDETISVAAITAVGRLAGPDAVAVLAPFIEQPAQPRGRAAIGALAQIGSEPAAEALMSLPTTALLEAPVVAAIVNAGLVPALVDRLSSALDELADEQRPAKMAALRQLVRGGHLSALQERLAGPHIAALDDANWGQRKRAAEALGKVGGDTALAALRRRLTIESDLELRRSIEEAIHNASA